MSLSQRLNNGYHNTGFIKDQECGLVYAQHWFHAASVCVFMCVRVYWLFEFKNGAELLNCNEHVTRERKTV